MACCDARTCRLFDRLILHRRREGYASTISIAQGGRLPSLSISLAPLDVRHNRGCGGLSDVEKEVKASRAFSDRTDRAPQKFKGLHFKGLAIRVATLRGSTLLDLVEALLLRHIVEPMNQPPHL